MGATVSLAPVAAARGARGRRLAAVARRPRHLGAGRRDAGERLLATRGRDTIGVYGDADAKRLRAQLSPEGSVLADPEARWRALSLGGEPVAPPPGRHPGVRRVLRHLRQAPPEADASLAALAKVAGLSPERFMRAFTDTVGIRCAHTCAG
jgi:hypothetical protein